MIEDKTKEPQTAEPAQQPPKKRGQKLRSLWAQFQCMQLLRRHRFRRRTQHHVNHFSQKLLQNRLVLIVGEALYALGFSAEYAFVRVGRTVCRGVSGALLWVRSLLHTIVSMAFPGAAQMVRDLFGPIVLFFRGMGSLLVHAHRVRKEKGFGAAVKDSVHYLVGGVRRNVRTLPRMAMYILPVLALGISTFVMLSTESLLSISFSSSLARYGGDVAVGAMTVITSASQLCTLPIQGVCQGGQPVMSFNFGAGKKPRVKEAFRFQLTLCGAYTCLFWLAMMLAPGAVAGIFTSDSALISYTTWAMRIYMAGIFAMGFQIACQQSFMALGQAKVSLLLACLRKIILLIPLIFILPHLVAAPVFGVFLAEPVSDILAATITTITFFARFDKILDQGAARV